MVLDCAGLGGDAAAARRWRFSRYVTLTTPLLRDMEARGVAVGALCAAGTLLAQSARAARAGAGAEGAALPPHVRWAFFSPSAGDIEQFRRLAERGQVCISQRPEHTYCNKLPAACCSKSSGRVGVAVQRVRGGGVPVVARGGGVRARGARGGAR